MKKALAAGLTAAFCIANGAAHAQIYNGSSAPASVGHKVEIIVKKKTEFCAGPLLYTQENIVELTPLRLATLTGEQQEQVQDLLDRTHGDRLAQALVRAAEANQTAVRNAAARGSDTVSPQELDALKRAEEDYKVAALAADMEFAEEVNRIVPLIAPGKRFSASADFFYWQDAIRFKRQDIKDAYVRSPEHNRPISTYNTERCPRP